MTVILARESRIRNRRTNDLLSPAPKKNRRRRPVDDRSIFETEMNDNKPRKKRSFIFLGGMSRRNSSEKKGQTCILPETSKSLKSSELKLLILRQTIEAHLGPIWAMAFSPDGKYLVSIAHRTRTEEETPAPPFHFSVICLRVWHVNHRSRGSLRTMPVTNLSLGRA